MFPNTFLPFNNNEKKQKKELVMLKHGLQKLNQCYKFKLITILTITTSPTTTTQRLFSF